MMFILGFVVCWIIAAIINFKNDCPDSKFYIPLYAIAIPFVTVAQVPYYMFQNVVRPWTFNHLAYAKKRHPDHWHDYGYWGWCYDPTAEYWFQRFFFYRIKKGVL